MIYKNYPVVFWCFIFFTSLTISFKHKVFLFLNFDEVQFVYFFLWLLVLVSYLNDQED